MPAVKIHEARVLKQDAGFRVYSAGSAIDARSAGSVMLYKTYKLPAVSAVKLAPVETISSVAN
jgi:hypothetical protein